MGTGQQRARSAASRIAMLQKRSDLLQRLRQFFCQRRFIEVETPLVSEEVIPERYIDPMLVVSQETCTRRREGYMQHRQWLQASPEMHMKRLLAEGCEAIFQVTRSFRAGEHGQLHNPEFTIVEWYRRGDDMLCGIDLLDELCQSLLQAPPAKRTSYAEAFQRQLAVCPHTCSLEELASSAAAARVQPPADFADADHDGWLNLLLAKVIEPRLGADRPEVLYNYPASQSALARIEHREGAPPVASRFELYFRGIELANGYHELTGAAELRGRLAAANDARQADGRQTLPLPELLLQAMQCGLPECTGVALGFDRLAMLAVGAKSLDQVMAFC